MKKLLYLFTLLVLATTLFTSCGKDDDEVVAAPQTGSIKATVNPANGATNMRLTQGSTTIEVSSNGNGTFQADNLQPGAYVVSFTAAMGYQAPQPQNATVTGGNITDLGTVTLTQPANQFLGSMSATVNGGAWNSIIHGATYDGDNLTITGSLPNLTGSASILALNLMNVTGPGTYTMPDAEGAFMITSVAGGTQSIWGSGGPGSSCTVTITKLDPVDQQVSGTFSFTAQPDPSTPATGNRVITNGTFTKLMIQ